MKKKNKGFTLAELLVVVAIIAVLVTISIPIFLGQTEKTKEAVDIANMRNAYAKVSYNAVMEEGLVGTKDKPVYYNGSTLTQTKPDAMGKGTKRDGGTIFSKCSDYEYNPTQDYTNSVITCWYDGTEIHIHWDSTSTSDNSSSDKGNNGGTTTDNSFNVIGELPSQDDLKKNNSNITIKGGTFYTYKGKTYYVTTDQTFNQWYYVEPSDNSTWLYISPTSKTLTSKDADTDGVLTDVHTGDIYKDGDSMWLRKSDSTHSNIPTKDSSEWYKIR